MDRLSDHLEEVERYGFNRERFPISYNGHRLGLLGNDAHFMKDGRLMFSFTLYCYDCERENSISGRFPSDDKEQVAHVCNARLAVFSEFQSSECVK